MIAATTSTVIVGRQSSIRPEAEQTIAPAQDIHKAPVVFAFKPEEFRHGLVAF
jgi:hypothetical protein